MCNLRETDVVSGGTSREIDANSAPSVSGGSDAASAIELAPIPPPFSAEFVPVAPLPAGEFVPIPPLPAGEFVPIPQSSAASASPLYAPIGGDLTATETVSPSEARDAGEDRRAMVGKSMPERIRYTPGEVRDNYDERTRCEQNSNNMVEKMRNM